jgi:phosphate transport system substrate-binding protein
MRKSIILLLVFIFALVAFQVSAAEIKVGGGGAACRGFFESSAESFEIETGIKVHVKASTPSQGLIELNDGHIDIATAAVPFEDMVKGAATNGIQVDPSQFIIHNIGTNKTLVFVNKSNTIKKLSKKQLQDIFSGKVTNWKHVGGANEEITVVWGIATPGQNALFTKQILGDKLLTRNIKEVSDYKSIRDYVARNKGAIGIDPHGFISGATRTPQIPLITAPVIAVTKGNPSPESGQLIKYVRDYQQ